MTRGLILAAVTVAGVATVGYHSTRAPDPAVIAPDLPAVNLPAVCDAPEVAYDRDYCAGLAAGTLLDPMPDSYVHVRDICDGIPRCSISNALYIAGEMGVGIYDADFETYVSPGDAGGLTAAVMAATAGGRR